MFSLVLFVSCDFLVCSIAPPPCHALSPISLRAQHLSLHYVSLNRWTALMGGCSVSSITHRCSFSYHSVPACLAPHSCSLPPPVGQHLKSHRAPIFIPTLRVLGASLPFQESLDTSILESCHTRVAPFPLSSPWALGMLLLQ